MLEGGFWRDRCSAIEAQSDGIGIPGDHGLRSYRAINPLGRHGPSKSSLSPRPLPTR